MTAGGCRSGLSCTWRHLCDPSGRTKKERHPTCPAGAWGPGHCRPACGAGGGQHGSSGRPLRRRPAAQPRGRPQPAARGAAAAAGTGGCGSRAPAGSGQPGRQAGACRQRARGRRGRQGAGSLLGHAARPAEQRPGGWAGPEQWAGGVGWVCVGGGGPAAGLCRLASCMPAHHLPTAQEPFCFFTHVPGPPPPCRPATCAPSLPATPRAATWRVPWQ